MKTAAVVLAAGASSRLGQPKQLVRFADRSLLRTAIDAARGAGCVPIFVVTGAAADSVLPELEGLPVTVVQHPRWADGMGTSIAAGVLAVGREAPSVEAVILLVCDQPLVTPSALERLIAVQRETSKSIVASAYAETLGVPVLFTRRWFAELCALSGHAGAKRIIEANRAEVASSAFPEGAWDIDTPAELAAFTAQGPTIFLSPHHDQTE